MLKNNRALIIITTVIILLPMVVGLIIWNSLPAEMPVHWNINGEVDRYAPRAFCVFALPVLMTALHWVCILATTLDKRARDQNPKLLSVMLLIIPILSLVIFGITYSTALGKNPRIETIIPLFMGILFILIGNYMPKFPRSRFIGFRIKWTLASDENWYRTHRFASRIAMIGGFLLAAISFTSHIIPCIAIMAIIIFVPIIYSYAYYVKNEK